ncbi:hypothetical protein LCGC14_1687900 [marine sediment metagenome]|uniref:Uncharacterized protein n=1 Tax=marine sediment metagenome TaxID=412755 RepID=A0A0F9K291_9ZZZZ
MLEMTKQAKAQYIATAFLIAVAVWLGTFVGAAL